MDKKRRAAQIIFWVIAVSTVIFSAYLAYYTFQVLSFDGKTIITGRVVDSSGDPLSGVNVTQDNAGTVTDEGGYFTLKDADQGIIRVDFFKVGYHPYTTQWLAYPDEKKWVGDNVSGSPNNLSQDGDVELLEEMKERVIDKDPLSGNLTLLINYSGQDAFENRTLSYRTTGEKPSRIELTNGSNEIIVKGTGIVYVGVGNLPQELLVVNPPGSVLNITDDLIEMVENNRSMRYKSTSTLNMFFRMKTETKGFNILFDEILTGDRTSKMVDPQTGAEYFNTTYDLSPGIYDITVYGPDVIDQKMMNVTLNASDSRSLYLTLERDEWSRGYENRDVSFNYLYAVFYIIIAGLLIYGSFRIRRERSSWAPLLIIAFLGFFTRGPVDILIFNINGILSIILVILIIYIRRDSLRKQRQVDSEDDQDFDS